MAFLAIPLVQACRRKAAALVLHITGTNYILGHRLWAKNFPTPTDTVYTPYIIIGGGISGLSAARYLAQQKKDFLLLELENEMGGNARNGQNKYSKYPIGAHYLPLPNKEDKPLLQFLEECGVVTGYDQQELPVFEARYLSFEPQERLFYRNSWQEDLLPKNENDSKLAEEIHRFSQLMNKFRQARGKDGRYIFNIPIDESSRDTEFWQLDNITMRQWMEENHFTATELMWYVDYSCRDDYGLGMKDISAWAGIHYFAARKNDYNNNTNVVLTWPEGNAFLTHQLKKYTEEKNICNCIAYNVSINKGKVEIEAYNNLTQKSIKYIADKAVMATPQFINRRIIAARKDTAKEFHYNPWLTATLTLNNLSQLAGYPLSWDNVIYGSKGLGYIFDQQQSLAQSPAKYVITYYYPLSGRNAAAARRMLYSRSESDWKKFIFNDLKTAHPDIETATESMEIFRNGHAMISPIPGFITSAAKQQAATSIDGKIFFAHSDLSGISIFEEAFHQGIKAAKKMIQI